MSGDGEAALKLRPFISWFPLLSAFLLAAGPATQPTAPPRAARSIHLSYSAKPALAFYNEVTVRRSTPGSYFMCCGYSHGYFGMQDLGDHKIALFSVWDPTRGNKAADVPEDQRVEVLYTGEGVAIKRFGGEGTGAQSRIDFDWKIGQTYRYLLTAKVEDQKTEYAAYLFMPDTKAWKHLATFRVTTGGDELRGLYSFIEDFRRNTKSAPRRAGRSLGMAGRWTWMGGGIPCWKRLSPPLMRSGEAKNTIDAGVIEQSFYLQTGGTTHESRAVGSKIERRATDTKPPELPEREREFAAGAQASSSIGNSWILETRHDGSP